MREEDPICRNLAIKQDAFFRACEREGFTMGVLATETGIPLSTLSSYRPTNARPQPALMALATFVKLGRVPNMPAHLLSLLIEDSTFVAARTDAQTSAWLAMGERACAFGAKVMRYQASDNHIDHREDADLRTDMIEIISEGHGMVGMPRPG